MRGHKGLVGSDKTIKSIKKEYEELNNQDKTSIIVAFLQTGGEPKRVSNMCKVTIDAVHKVINDYYPVINHYITSEENIKNIRKSLDTNNALATDIVNDLLVTYSIEAKKIRAYAEKVDKIIPEWIINTASTIYKDVFQLVELQTRLADKDKDRFLTRLSEDRRKDLIIDEAIENENYYEDNKESVLNSLSGKIRLTNTETNEVLIFNNPKEAGRALGITDTAIYDALNSNRNEFTSNGVKYLVIKL